MFSSAYEAWDTPQDFYNKLDLKFRFILDACCDIENKKAINGITKEQNALSVDWLDFATPIPDCEPAAFMNPPYGRGIGAFVKKAYEQSLKGITVVCLLPARTDTQWFHHYCVKGDVDFIKGRLVFGSDKYWEYVWSQPYLPDGKGGQKKNSLFCKTGKRNSAPFPSMVVVFKAHNTSC